MEHLPYKPVKTRFRSGERITVMDFERHRSLQQAMTALAGGDREAFDVAYREAHALLFAYARRILGDGPDAEDATQQALLNLFRNAVRFDGSRDALPWILSIGANTCRTELRRRRRRREVSTPPDQLEPPGETANPEREIIDPPGAKMVDSRRLLRRRNRGASVHLGVHQTRVSCHGLGARCPGRPPD